MDDEVNGMFDVGAETLALPLEEKMKFEQGDSGFSFGSVFTSPPYMPALTDLALRCSDTRRKA